MRATVLLTLAVGVILIGSSALGHHKLGHQSPNYPRWGVPTYVDCLHIESQIKDVKKLVVILPEDSYLLMEAEERLRLLRCAFASRCRII